MDWPFFLTLVSLIVASVAVRDTRALETAAVLTINWGACSLYLARTGDVYPWPIFAAFDYAAGFAVLKLLRHPPNLWQCAVATLYAAELVCHAARGYLGTPAAIYYGWHFLNYAAWAQAVVIGTWIGYDVARRGGLPDRGARLVRAGVDRVAQAAR